MDKIQAQINSICDLLQWNAPQETERSISNFILSIDKAHELLEELKRQAVTFDLSQL